MTAFSKILRGEFPSRANKKDGPRRQPARITGFWGRAGFMPTFEPGRWIYSWPVNGFPEIEVVEEIDGKIAAFFKADEIATFQDTPHIQIADFLDDKILEMIRLDADIADPPPMVVGGEIVGPEIPF